MNIRSLCGALVGALLLTGAAACLSDADRCLPGYLYVSAYHSCVAVTDASANDAAPEVDAATDSAAPTTDAATGGATGLGAACLGDGDCAGKRASYCLKDPLSPSDPGVCSVPKCTAEDCGAAYACCDCSGASVPELQSWPRGVCVPNDNTSTIGPLGCSCQ